MNTGWIERLRKARGLGDVVAAAAKPIAQALNLDCLDAQGDLKPESQCAKRRLSLNRAIPFKGQEPPIPGA